MWAAKTTQAIHNSLSAFLSPLDSGGEAESKHCRSDPWKKSLRRSVAWSPPQSGRKNPIRLQKTPIEQALPRHLPDSEMPFPLSQSEDTDSCCLMPEL